MILSRLPLSFSHLPVIVSAFGRYCAAFSYPATSPITLPMNRCGPSSLTPRSRCRRQSTQALSLSRKLRPTRSSATAPGLAAHVPADLFPQLGVSQVERAFGLEHRRSLPHVLDLCNARPSLLFIAPVHQSPLPAAAERFVELDQRQQLVKSGLR